MSATCNSYPWTIVCDCNCTIFFFQALNQSRGNPSTVLHILHVFARGGVYESMGLSADLRQLAGLVIKNYTFPHLPRLPPAVQQMLKQEMLHALTDTQPDIRNTAGILIGRISESFMIDTWADLLPPLYQMLDFKQHGQVSLVDGALQVALIFIQIILIQFLSLFLTFLVC